MHTHRTEFQTAVAELWRLAWPETSQNDAEATAVLVVRFETLLANGSVPRAELRDPLASYNIYSAAELDSIVAPFSISAYFEALQAPTASLAEINADAPSFFAALGQALQQTPLSDVKAYLKWRLLSSHAARLSEPIAVRHWQFFGHYLNGQAAMPPRWEFCFAETEQVLGELIGHYFVEKYFSPNSKSMMIKMMSYLQRAFQSRVHTLSWMDAATQEAALRKSRAMASKLGYPDVWDSLAGLPAFSPETFFENVVAASGYQNWKEVQAAGKPYDHTKWFMYPHQVNAYNAPSQNEIVFPAGILQPPFFSETQHAAMNMGGIGMVIGHELTHGFDDQGSQFDHTGNLSDWWSAQSKAQFAEKTACVSDLYSSYSINGTHVNGALTLGENIADFGGVAEAFFAYQLMKSENASCCGLPSGFPLSDTQLFFVAFAQTWCDVRTPQSELLRLRTDPHSPPRFRVNGPLSNFPPFYEAFSCPAGSKMVRPAADRCEVW
eukprot:TRINITY_DN5827_c0_g1_i2.p1 TRINITY_DN5827_c0_g1~~TRINITY_DN5827_c0_g1_i2.p1  ORF type:complete len:494 (+),score=118.11 TRINITY_DN5827_c0_g1_i2:770-2251(+)